MAGPAVSVSDVRRIAGMRAPWCVTIYGDAAAWLRGDHPDAAAESQIRLAIEALIDARAPADAVAAIRGLLSTAASRSRLESIPFDRRVRAVAIFATPVTCEMFPLDIAPPFQVSASDRFVVGPLLAAALALDPPVFVLAASENALRLIDVTAHPATTLDVPGLPLNLASTVDLDLTHDRETLAHLRTSEDPKERLREYARAIVRVVEPVVRHAGAMLVIGAAEPLASIIHADAILHIGPTRILAPWSLHGNPDGLSADQLADLAAALIGAERERAREARIARLDGTEPELALRDVAAIEAALRAHDVDTLFVEMEGRSSRGGRLPEDPFEGRGEELVHAALGSGAAIVPLRAGDRDRVGHARAILRHRMQA